MNCLKFEDFISNLQAWSNIELCSAKPEEDICGLRLQVPQEVPLYPQMEYHPDLIGKIYLKLFFFTYRHSINYLLRRN